MRPSFPGAPPHLRPRPARRRPPRTSRYRPGGPGQRARPDAPTGGGDRLPAREPGLGAARTAQAGAGLAGPAAPRPAGLPPLHRRHQGGPVRRLFAHHEYLCTRHGYWTGPPDPSRDDPPLPLAAQVPELAAAQRTLDRTRRLHGWEAAFDATVVATSICIELRSGRCTAMPA